jgi:hypothetical protein
LLEADGGGEPGRPGADNDDVIVHRLAVAHPKALPSLIRRISSLPALPIP